jgi:hypothetical protein
MIINTQFVKHFTFTGTFENHLGIFKDCGKKIPFNQTNNCDKTSGCC